MGAQPATSIVHGPLSLPPPPPPVLPFGRSYGGPNGFSTEISPGGAPLTLGSWLKAAGHEGTDTDDGAGGEGGGSAAWCPADGGPFSDAWTFHCGSQHGIFRNLSHFVPPLDARYTGHTGHMIKFTSDMKHCS